MKQKAGETPALPKQSGLRSKNPENLSSNPAQASYYRLQDKSKLKRGKTT